MNRFTSVLKRNLRQTSKLPRHISQKHRNKGYNAASFRHLEIISQEKSINGQYDNTLSYFVLHTCNWISSHRETISYISSYIYHRNHTNHPVPTVRIDQRFANWGLLEIPTNPSQVTHNPVCIPTNSVAHFSLYRRYKRDQIQNQTHLMMNTPLHTPQKISIANHLPPLTCLLSPSRNEVIA